MLVKSLEFRIDCGQAAPARATSEAMVLNLAFAAIAPSHRRFDMGAENA